MDKETDVKLNKTCYLVTFGCQQNEADTERAEAILLSMGYKRVDDYHGVDLILVNTCAIREHAEVKALSLIGGFQSEKRANPSLVIGIIGCMASEGHIVARLKERFQYVSFTIEPNMLHCLSDAINAYLNEGKRTFILGKDDGTIHEGLPPVRQHKHKAWVSIMYGCNNFCSYCIVPYTRGRERSRESREIIEEVRLLIESGCKDITLLGQNVNSYKSDITFPELLDEICRLDGDFLIRFMTSHPKDVSDELISVMRDNRDKIAPYFHLPLQSGSDKILKSMHRSYNRERFISVARRLRAEIPGICLSTDVIVGFPGESEEDFLDTLGVLREVEFDMVYAFKYSKREGTPAARMDGQIDPTIARERLDRLLKMQDEISKRLSLAYVNREERVLVDSISRASCETFSARTASNKLVHFTSANARIGEFTRVIIKDAGVYDLYAEEI